MYARSIFLLYVTFYMRAGDALFKPAQYGQVADRGVLTNATSKVGEPLFLTPLIDQGNLNEAKNRSRVTPPLVENIESYAGFLTVNRTAGSHLHFWFIPRTVNDNRTVPLILCLREMYSSFALFYENGPFQLTRGGLQKRDQAWTNNYHVLYIDTLCGVGYSFTERGGFARSYFDVGRYLYEALLQFYKLFPEFRASDLYITGDAGTYIPALAHKIHTANERPNAFKMPLKGIAIGNGISDYEESFILYATYLHSIGLIDMHERRRLEAIMENVKYAIRSGNWTLANIDGDVPMVSLIGQVDFYDYTRDMSHSEELIGTYKKFMTQDNLRERIHVGRAEFDSDIMAIVASRGNFGQPVRPLIEELLQEHYQMLFYNGQYDLSSSHLVNRNFLSRLHWHGAFEFNLAKKRIWRFRNSTDERLVAGYYTKAQNLAYVMVRNAGHLTAYDQPQYTLSMIDSFIGQRGVENGTAWLGD